MTYYVNIEFENRNAINLYRGTSDRLARVYLDIAHLLIVSFDARDVARISYANADSPDIFLCNDFVQASLISEASVCKASSFEAEESKHRAEFAQHIDDTLARIEEIS